MVWECGVFFWFLVLLCWSYRFLMMEGRKWDLWLNIVFLKFFIVVLGDLSFFVSFNGLILNVWMMEGYRFLKLRIKMFLYKFGWECMI